MTLDQILGWIATILFSVLLVPQIIKTWRTQTVEGVSLALFVLYLISNVIALAYALLIDEAPLIIKYVIAIATSVLYLWLYWRIVQRNRAEVSELAAHRGPPPAAGDGELGVASTGTDTRSP